MDEQSKATLDQIVVKEPAALSESEIAFLRARRSYLTEHQKSVFAEFLIEEQPAAEQGEETPADETKTDEAPKKGRKSKTEDEA